MVVEGGSDPNPSPTPTQSNLSRLFCSFDDWAGCARINRSRMSPPPRREGDRDAAITCNCSKRRRLARGGSDGGDGGEDVRPWASLAQDLVELIAWRVLAGDLLDNVRLRAVCSHRTKSTLRPRGRGLVDPRFHPRRWMMLPEGHGLYPGHPNLGGYVRFFSLTTTSPRFVRVHLPLFDDHVVLDSVDGLLLLLLHREHGTTIRLSTPSPATSPSSHRCHPFCSRRSATATWARSPISASSGFTSRDFVPPSPWVSPGPWHHRGDSLWPETPCSPRHGR
ncbi:hypothetical protein GQ55_2G398900 [Panicum hallii var. hallii]|uniref:Uncharacterized protein n=1 Tax=Panicum hallii var. hallii TaxID=1504633 RepID=A0A2T7EXE7_9POAL|nr:hypothetical protein GQ55_2G398900 [Panicum hallii var. hallii]